MVDDNDDDSFPKRMRYVRSSERLVRDDVYLAATDLLAIGLSPKESLKAIEIVSNRLFERSFHQIDSLSKSDSLNQNTLPTERSIRDMAERVEAHGLAMGAKEVLTRNNDGDIINHAGDSTTKRHVGKFYVSGLHINKERTIPLTTVPVAGEARDEIAAQAALGFQLLAAACEPPMDPAEIYRSIDLHLTDSTSHNKHLAEDVPKLFNLDLKIGQIFCSTHTGLGFCASLNSSINQIEQKLGFSNIMDGFLVEIEYESKNGSLVGQFVDCITRLLSISNLCVGAFSLILSLNSSTGNSGMNSSDIP